MSILNKIFHIFIISTFLYVLPSCKKIADTDISDSKNIDQTLQTSIDIAITISENINKSDIVTSIIKKNKKKSGKYFGKKKIKNNISILDKERKETYFNVLNFVSGGFVVISADKR